MIALDWRLALAVLVGAALAAFAIRRTKPAERSLAVVLVPPPAPLQPPTRPTPGCSCPRCQLRDGLNEAVRRGGVFVQDVPRGPRA